MRNFTIHKFLFASFLFTLTIIMVSCGSSRRSIAIEEGWELLGESKVNFVKDKDIMEIHSSNKFTAIRFRIEEREVRLNDLNIYFQNGDKLSPTVDDIIPPDTYSRDFQLGYEGKFITKVEFKYRTTGNVLKGRARVLVFGKKY